jgi:hypothetical protein
MKGTRGNIRKVLDAADETDISEGRVSYFRYHEVLQNLAAFWGVPFERVVAVFAALSPNVDYNGCLRSTASVLKGWKDGADVNLIRVATYTHCRDRAFEYLNGLDYLETVKGPKIRAFYMNILQPMNRDFVTIDGHAVNIWRGKQATLKSIVGGFKYERVADDYRAVAARVGLLPNQVQGITWFTWKRINNIVYAGRQLELFNDNSADLWATLRNPATIRPFDYFDKPSYSTLGKPKNEKKETLEIGGPVQGSLYLSRGRRRKD